LKRRRPRTAGFKPVSGPADNRAVKVPIDPFASYVICGAASAIAAAMLLVARQDEERLEQVIGLLFAGFALIALSLLQLLATAPDPGPVASAVMLVGTYVSVILFAAAFARLSGQSWFGLRWAAVAAIGGGAGIVASPLLGELAPGRAYALASCLAAALLLAGALPFLRRPRNLAEQTLAWATILYLASWLLRAATTLAYQGPRLPHELYVPPQAQLVYAMLYATLPIMMSALIMNVINARLHERLQARAATDELTGALMRRALREQAPQALARAASAGRHAALLMVDIDHFKTINDGYGHAAGDEVLRQLAHTLRAQLRPDALVARYGGEEFIVVVEVGDVAAARGVAERLRLAVAAMPCRLGGGVTVEITVSIGVAIVGPGEELEKGLERADEAMYRAKRAGRDRVEVGIGAAA
jgi:diguanylate cyclase (GGDEF)-like protein